MCWSLGWFWCGGRRCDDEEGDEYGGGRKGGWRVLLSRVPCSKVYKKKKKVAYLCDDRDCLQSCHSAKRNAQYAKTDQEEHALLTSLSPSLQRVFPLPFRSEHANKIKQEPCLIQSSIDVADPGKAEGPQGIAKDKRKCCIRLIPQTKKM